MVPGVIDKLLPGMALTEAMQIPPEEYCGRVLARICESALTQKDNLNAKFINYEQLPEAAVSTVLEHFDITYSAEEIGQMESASRFDAKMPRLRFIPDSEKKKSEASDAACRAANDWVEPFYRQLETIRRTADAN